MRTLFITTTNVELKKMYAAIIDERNTQALTYHPNAGFDLFNPLEIDTSEDVVKIDTQVVWTIIFQLIQINKMKK
jgi:hypothetical protein